MTAKPPEKGDLSKAFAKKARRTFRGALRHDAVWGVPTKIIPFSQIEKMAPANLTREEIWSRDFDVLSENEKEFYREHAVRVWERTNHKIKKKWKQPRELYEHVRSAFHDDLGDLASVVSFANYGQELEDIETGDDGVEPGKENDTGFAKRDFAYVMIDDMHTADWMLEAWIQPAAFESLKPKGVNDDAFHYWILQHEFAHISGAGEAQADMIASAAYMKEFGTDDIPRLMGDLRAVSAMASLRRYAQLEHALEHPKKLRDLWPPRRRRLKKALEAVTENLRSYGLACVEGIDRWVAYGTRMAATMSEEDLYNLKDSKTERRNNLGRELVRDVTEHSGRTPTLETTLSETSFARDLRAWMADKKANGDQILPPGEIVKLDIAQRYLRAVDNLIQRDFEPKKGGMPSPVNARARAFPKWLHAPGRKGGPT